MSAHVQPSHMHCDKFRVTDMPSKMTDGIKNRYILYFVKYVGFGTRLIFLYFHSLSSEYRFFCYFLNAGKLCLLFSICVHFLTFKMQDGVQMQSSCLSHTLTESYMARSNNQNTQKHCIFISHFSPTYSIKLRPLLRSRHLLKNFNVLEQIFIYFLYFFTILFKHLGLTARVFNILLTKAWFIWTKRV